MRFISLWCVLTLVALSCKEQAKVETNLGHHPEVNATSIVVLGTAQDAGSPQLGCQKVCCKDLFKEGDHSRKVVCLGLIDKAADKNYLIEATPDLRHQEQMLRTYSKQDQVDGIFLTHAHIGHYTGLMYLGKESMDAQSMPVYVMPQMRSFLEQNGPWDQLVKRKNIALQQLKGDSLIQLREELAMTPFKVPHRDEYSETVGYRIDGPKRSALFIPDIDKWGKWSKDIKSEIQSVDYAFVDATFYDAAEINHRDISQIPHPFVIESMQLFEGLTAADKQKVIFIHFNHTNPLLNKASKAYQKVIQEGYRVALQGDIYPL